MIDIAFGLHGCTRKNFWRNRQMPKKIEEIFENWSSSVLAMQIETSGFIKNIGQTGGKRK